MSTRSLSLRLPRQLLLATLGLAWLALACDTPATETSAPEGVSASSGDMLLAKYTPFPLATDLALTDTQRQMIPFLIAAADAMDEVFWQQAFGSRQELLDSIEDPAERRFAEINYGPWDRLDGDRPFVDGYGKKPPGATFYPDDLTAEDLEAAIEAATEAGDPGRAEALRSQYTVVRRGDSGLETVPYSTVYAEPFGRAAENLRAAAGLADNPALKRYLELRAASLLSDDYYSSDLAWMEMKDNILDIVIGPIETYEDQLMGFRAAAEAYVLVKDSEWSDRLARYGALLPELQANLPVTEEYRREVPGTDSDLNAYDVLYVTGDANAGSKTIAINLPNDERVQLEKGTRRLQLKNAMRAKFDKILLPIADVLIDPSQRSHITFDAFFSNTMFHEVAHGLGIKQTLDGSSTVRRALKDRASALEEGKADVLGLFMVTWLHNQGELGEDHDLNDNYVTFLASIFRSIRFGSSSAHGVANLLRFNYFKSMNAFTRDEGTGTYHVDFEAMEAAMASLSGRILELQGNGDYDGVGQLLEDFASEGPLLRQDLERLNEAGIPVDITFEQGLAQLGLAE